MKLTKLGHCCLLIEIRGIRFLTDPGSYTTEQNTVRGIHYVVISHEHTDHLHIESVKAIIKNNPDVKIVCNSSVGAKLTAESILFTLIEEGVELELSGVTLTGYGTKHAPIYKDYEQVENTGVMFDGKLFNPGDSFHNPNVPVDILALPVTGPWCTIAHAVNYALEVKPRIAFPIHDGNLKRQNGITVRLPGIELPKAGITFLPLELGKETNL